MLWRQAQTTTGLTSERTGRPWNVGGSTLRLVLHGATGSHGSVRSGRHPSVDLALPVHRAGRGGGSVAYLVSHFPPLPGVVSPDMCAFRSLLWNTQPVLTFHKREFIVSASTRIHVREQLAVGPPNSCEERR